jgi:hypothetical protein
MDNYQAQDVTKRANSISRSFCNGRVQYNGRGLVHQLTWPVSPDNNTPTTPTQPRYVNVSSLKKLFNIYQSSSAESAAAADFVLPLDGCDSSLHCKVTSVSWSSDYKRVHFHVNPSCISSTFKTVATAVSIMDNDNADEDILVDLTACDQIIASKESAMFIGFSILYCSLYLISMRKLENDRLIPISDFLDVYKKLIESIVSIDGVIMSASKHSVQGNESMNNNRHTSITQFVYKLLCDNNHNNVDYQLPLSEICHQRESNFVLALNRVRGLKFSYLD